MIVPLFKQIALTLGYTFDHGGFNWQNLNDFITYEDIPLIENEAGEMVPGEVPIYFLSLWKECEKTYNEFNRITALTYAGEFLLVVRSSFSDPTYIWKYENRIALVESKSELVSAQIAYCDGWIIQRWKEIEIVNQLDTNVDGLKIQYTIRIDL